MNIQSRSAIAASICILFSIGAADAAERSLQELEKEMQDSRKAYQAKLEEELKATKARAEALAAQVNALDGKAAAAPKPDKKTEDKKAEEKKADDKKDAVDQAKLIAAELKKWPTDQDSYVGDILKFKADIFSFRQVGDPADGALSEEEFCAPKFSKARVLDEDNEYLTVNFKKVRNTPVDWLPFVDREGGECEDLNGVSGAKQLAYVNMSARYKIKKDQISEGSFYRRGFTYGALVIPFKYFTGGEKRVSGSSTVAPYVGWRGLDINGLNFTPTVSAGLAFVPVSTTTTDDMGMESTTQETKPAFSYSAGIMLSSPKNDKFSAGIMIGKDRLSTKDRMADPTAGKTWISVFAGIQFDSKK